MKNLDTCQKTQIELLAQAAAGLRENDEKKAAEAFQKFSKAVHDEFIAEVNEITANTDKAILSNRGQVQLTSEEMSYFSEFIGAAKSSNPQQAITNISKDFPETIFRDVLDDVKSQHPLLADIDFKNTSALTKFIINTQGSQTAVWGALNDAVTKELSGAIDEIDLTQCKLSAFMYVSFDMLDLGPAWVVAYVKEILTEAIAVSLETAIVDGSGVSCPIGMTRDLTSDFNASTGYSRKTATTVTTLDAIAYGQLLKPISKKPNGGYRNIENLVLVVNPGDYLTKIMPATTVFGAGGTYVNNVLPYPTKIIQSVAVPDNHAILGLSKRYFMGVGTGKNGKLNYDDSYKFLEDVRTYKMKLHANGRPLDNNAFVYLDITNLKAPAFSVYDNTPVATGE